jgi:hypothetical protein
LNDVFEQLLILAHEAGCLKVGRVSLDGTKIRANASKHNALSLKRMLKQAAEADRDDNDDDEFHLPSELARREDRIRAIKAAKNASGLAKTNALSVIKRTGVRKYQTKYGFSTIPHAWIRESSGEWTLACLGWNLRRLHILILT